MSDTNGATEIEEFQNPTEWANYGDMTPAIHGGRFLRWDGDHWLIVETRNLEEVGPEGMIRDGEKWMIQTYSVYPDDVFPDGDPENGLTDEMKSILESLSDENYDPDNYPEHPTEYAPEFAENIGYYVADIPSHSGIHGDDHYTADYWEYLEQNHGIAPEEMDVDTDV